MSGAGAHGAKPKNHARAVGGKTGAHGDARRSADRRWTRRPIDPGELRHLERLGQAVRGYRQAAGLTQQALADAAELSRSQVERIENVARRTRTSTLERIADAIARRIGTTAREVLDELTTAAGPALAPESEHRERVDERRDRRHRVTHVEIGGQRFHVGQQFTTTPEQAAALKAELDRCDAVKVGRTMRYVPREP